MIECFERASNPYLPIFEKERLLTFVMVGGGPTSVEIVAEMYDFISEDIRFPSFIYLRKNIFTSTNEKRQ